jgi:hypothetical protein
MNKCRLELDEMRRDLGVTTKVYCTKEEQNNFQKMKKAGETISSAGNGQVFVDSIDGRFYRNVTVDLTNDEINQLMTYRQMQYLKNISSGITFFVVLSIISGVLGIIFWYF